MDIQATLKQQYPKVKEIFANNGLECSTQDYESLLRFLFSTHNGLFRLSRFISDHWKVSEDRADIVDQQLFDRFIEEYYDELVDHNATLQFGVNDTSDELETNEFVAEHPSVLKNVGGTTVNIKANHYFSVDDEAEIREIKQRGIWNKGEIDGVYERVADKVIQKVNI